MSTPLSAAVDPCGETPFHTAPAHSPQNRTRYTRLPPSLTPSSPSLHAAGAAACLRATVRLLIRYFSYEREGGGAMRRESTIIYFCADAPISGVHSAASVSSTYVLPQPCPSLVKDGFDSQPFDFGGEISVTGNVITVHKIGCAGCSVGVWATDARRSIMDRFDSECGSAYFGSRISALSHRIKFPASEF